MLPSLCSYFDIAYNAYLNIPLVGSIYLFYTILGYLLHSEPLDKKCRIAIYLAAIVSVVIRGFSIYYLSLRDGALNWLMSGYEQWHCVFLSAAVFIAVKNIDWGFLSKKEWVTKVLVTVSSCGLGIFLAHMMILEEEYKILAESILPGWKWRAFAPFTVWVVSLIMV